MNLHDLTVKEAGEHLGDLIWWTLSDVRIAPGMFKELLIKNGFDEKLCPDYNSDTAFNRICRLRQQRFDDHILRLISHENTIKQVVWGIIREVKDQKSKKLQHYHVASLTLDEVKNQLSVDVSTDPYIVSQEGWIEQGIRIAEEIKKVYYEWDGLLSDQEVRPILMKLLKESSSLTVREAGGVYFIPGNFAKISRGMYDIIQRIGSSSAFLFAIYDDENSRKNLTGITKMSIEEELQKLFEEIEKFDLKTRASTVNKRLEEFQNIRNKANLYKSMLKITDAEIENKINELETKAKAVIIQKAKPEMSVQEILDDILA